MSELYLYQNARCKNKKILKYKISLKSAQWEPGCSVRTDRRPDNEAVVASRSFANAPKTSLICRHIVFMAFLSISEQTAILSLNSFSCAVAVTVGTGFLDVI